MTLKTKNENVSWWLIHHFLSTSVSLSCSLKIHAQLHMCNEYMCTKAHDWVGANGGKPPPWKIFRLPWKNVLNIVQNYRT